MAQFAVIWVSPRGFCNEGWFIWGRASDCRLITDRYKDNVDARYETISTHRLATAAQARAEREARREARQRAAWAEIDATSAIYAKDWLSERG